MKDKKTKRLRIFDFQRDGRGISKRDADLGPGFKRFFITYKNSFSKLVSVNIFMVLGNFPLIFLIANLSGYFKKEFFLPFSDLFQNINGIFVAEGALSPYKLTLFALEGLQHQSLAHTTVNYVFYGISALSLLTFGLVNVGTAYILRNIVTGEPVFAWHDFWYAVKRNYKQAIIFGAIDVIINVILCFNLYSLITDTAKFFASMLFWSTVVLFVVFFFMRYYIYIQMVTFKLSIFKMIKNALIFALLGFKRNILAFLGTILLVVFEFAFLVGWGGILISVAVIAPLTILFSTLAFMKVYAAYPKMKQYMIDPYLEEHPEEKAEDIPVETIMKDDVSEKQRLEEIKKRNNIVG